MNGYLTVLASITVLIQKGICFFLSKTATVTGKGRMPPTCNYGESQSFLNFHIFFSGGSNMIQSFSFMFESHRPCHCMPLHRKAVCHKWILWLRSLPIAGKSQQPQGNEYPDRGVYELFVMLESLSPRQKHIWRQVLWLNFLLVIICAWTIIHRNLASSKEHKTSC